MRKTAFTTMFVMILLIASFGIAYASKPIQTDGAGNETAWEAAKAVCATIQEGTLVYPAGRYLAGQLLQTGFDEFGYNYQGHLFMGSYANVYLNGDGFPPYEGDDAVYAQRLADEGFTTNPYGKWYWDYRMYDLQMKWDDMWLANTDCDGDGSFDRHFGFPSYIGSGAWQTNQYGGDGWASLTKFSAVPTNAVLSGGNWYTSDGILIGESIWGEFAVTQDVLSGEGALFVSPAGPGYGQY